MMQEETIMLKKTLTYDRIRIIMAIMLSMIMACVFFGMTLDLRGMYWSDSPDHIEAAIKLEGYGLETVIFYFVSKFAGYPFLQFLFAIWETILVMTTWFFCQKFIDDYFHIDRWMILLISTGLMFLCSIYIPVICPTFYMHSLGTQPWHSSTQFAMRLGAIIFLYYFLDAFVEYRNGISIQKWFRMSIWLGITTIFKPNFFMSFCAAFGIVLLRDLLKYKTKKVFKQIIQFGCIIVPSFAVLSVQYWLIYASETLGSSSDIQVVFFSDWLWEGNTIHMLFKFGRDMAFPLVVWFIFLWEKKQYEKNFPLDDNDQRRIKFLILMYLVSLVVLSLFKETGHRANHGNFTWGVLACYFTLFLYLVPTFIKCSRIYRKNILTGGKRIVMIEAIFGVGFALLSLHAVSGLLYFHRIVTGKIYWR